MSSIDRFFALLVLAEYEAKKYNRPKLVMFVRSYVREVIGSEGAPVALFVDVST